MNILMFFLEPLLFVAVLIGMFVVACLLILAAVAVEYYIKKWRGKK